MFLCAENHQSEHHEIRTLVPTKIRRVENTHYIIDEKNKKTVIFSIGEEIVEEKAFCQKHLDAVVPTVEKVVVTRTHNFKIKPIKDG